MIRQTESSVEIALNKEFDWFRGKESGRTILFYVIENEYDGHFANFGVYLRTEEEYGLFVIHDGESEQRVLIGQTLILQESIISWWMYLVPFFACRRINKLVR